MDRESAIETGKTVLKVVAVTVLVGGLLLGVLIATGVLQMPSVQDIDKDWGAVTNETTAIETTAVVRNPNPVGIPGVVTVRFTAQMNDVILTEGNRSGIGLSSGTNTITLSSAIPNDRIATWWVTHVNNDETSTLRIDPVVSGPLFYRNLPNRTSTLETDLLAPLESSSERTLGVGDRPLLVVHNQTAAWGTATNETTPLEVSATVRNVHDYDVTLAGVEYVVRMNGVTLGRGMTSEGFAVQPGQNGTLTVDADLDTQRFGTWWPTHVRNNETSRMAVEMYGYFERNGTRQRVPLSLYQERLRFQTDILRDGGTTVESLPATQQDPISVPTIRSTSNRWGAVTDATTAVETSVSFSTPDGFDRIRDLARIRIDRRVAINNVTVADTTSTVDQLPEDGQLTTTTATANDRVPEWWARHINNGETTTVDISTDAVADVGFTRFGFDTPEDRRTLTTDILDELGTSEGRPVVVDDRTVLHSGATTAEWGEATPDRVPLTVRTTLSNEVRVPVDVSAINYTVSINGITLADGVSSETYTIDPGETRPITVSMGLDNAKMDSWWVTHVRNGEQSHLSVNATATVSVGGTTETVPLRTLSQTASFTTDLFE